ncbi:hypothetical protein HDE_03803 [Halotydeus destructor]|nr:hypothetical protein HDE_03803 [Halotydeus destructor]
MTFGRLVVLFAVLVTLASHVQCNRMKREVLDFVSSLVTDPETETAAASTGGDHMAVLMDFLNTNFNGVVQKVIGYLFKLALNMNMI